jgi:UDPglucose--hexose-1-phosphate uridylyltransferase
MSELRWNPTLEEWVATATHRMDRPQMPKDWCPFCPGSGLVPENYDVYLYPNDYPTFSTPPPARSVEGKSLYRVEDAVGTCDVVLYSPDHNASLASLEVGHITKLVRLWQGRFRELAGRGEIKYVFIFENNGEVIGVTMPHPHGQIYAFPFIPPKAQKELDASLKHYRAHNGCLFCDILRAELSDGRRIVLTEGDFVAFVPFYARYPFEVHIYPRTHLGTIAEIASGDIFSLAKIIKKMIMTYNNLYGFPFPYMMVMHQSPTDGGDYRHYHFHVEFYPPYRSRTKLKYLAGCESGAGTFINDSSAEEKAAELRESYQLLL